MNCPICHDKNVSAGHILGHGGKGVPKTLSKAESNRRRERLAENRYRGGRKPGVTNLDNRTPEAKP